MKIITAEKNFDGLCAALFLSFTERILPDAVTDKTVYQPSLDSETFEASALKAKTARVASAIFRYGGDSAVGRLKICLLSSDENAFFIAFKYARKLLESRRDISDMLSDKDVTLFDFTVDKVLKEKHRLHGFIRFTVTESGVLYAPISPDNDVTELVAPHFLKRLGDTPFVIHDVRRNRYAISDGKKIFTGTTEKQATVKQSEQEKEFLSLWKRYFKTVNIEERKNLRQQDSYMPRRYRKFMPETFE